MREQGSTSVDHGAAPPLFQEAQRFRIWMFWVPIVIVTFVVWWQFSEQIIRNNPQGTQPIPNWAAWVLVIVFGVGFPAFAFVVRLMTEVHSGELTVRVFPFRTARIPLADVHEAEVREYSAQREFGGWGVRTGHSGKAYSAYGNEGVQLWLKEDRRILIGSQRAEDLAAALKAAGVNVR
jgi:Family of unknown function (DUF6141)